jgi:hypothetical protein
MTRSSSSAITTKRYYSLGSTVVAVRDTATTSLHYLLGDQLGSTTVSVNASTGATQTQRFLPYGAPRSGSIPATDRGWIGQTKDSSTGLQYLNAGVQILQTRARVFRLPDRAPVRDRRP